MRFTIGERVALRDAINTQHGYVIQHVHLLLTGVEYYLVAWDKDVSSPYNGGWGEHTDDELLSVQHVKE